MHLPVTTNAREFFLEFMQYTEEAFQLILDCPLKFWIGSSSKRENWNSQSANIFAVQSTVPKLRWR